MRSGLLLALLVSARPTFSPCRDQPALVPQRVIRQVFSALGRESDLADGWDRSPRGVYWRMVQNLARRLTRLARADRYVDLTDPQPAGTVFPDPSSWS